MWCPMVAVADLYAGPSRLTHRKHKKKHKRRKHKHHKYHSKKHSKRHKKQKKNTTKLCQSASGSGEHLIDNL